MENSDRAIIIGCLNLITFGVIAGSFISIPNFVEWDTIEKKEEEKE